MDSEYESEEENGVNTHYPISMYLFGMFMHKIVRCELRDLNHLLFYFLCIFFSGVAVVVAVVVSIVVVLLTQGNNSNNGDAPWADAFHTGHNRKGN